MDKSGLGISLFIDVGCHQVRESLSIRHVEAGLIQSLEGYHTQHSITIFSYNKEHFCEGDIRSISFHRYSIMLSRRCWQARGDLLFSLNKEMQFSGPTTIYTLGKPDQYECEVLGQLVFSKCTWCLARGIVRTRLRY